MTNIITKLPGLAELNTLRSNASSAEEPRNHVSSGDRVEAAADHAAYWSVAATMRSDIEPLSAEQDAPAFDHAGNDSASTGLNAALDVVSEIRLKLVAAREPGVDRLRIGSDRTEAVSPIASPPASADIPTRDVSAMRSDGTATADGEVDDMISAVQSILASMTDATAMAGLMNMRIELQEASVADLLDVIDADLGRLIDTDMDEDAVMLRALEAQRQLGNQPLSIANANAENLLSLLGQATNAD